MRVKKVEFIKDYKLKLFFNDNKIKIVDLEQIVTNGKGMFIPLKKSEYFKQVFVDIDQITICWPNGADLSPDVLYEIGKDVEVTKKQTQPSNPRKSKHQKAEIKYHAYALTKKISKKSKS